MQFERIENVHMHVLRRMVRGGMSRKSSLYEIKKANEAMNEGKEEEEMIRINWAWKHTKEDIFTICRAEKPQEFIEKNERCVAHVVLSNECITKRLLHVDEKYTKIGYHHKTVYERVSKLQQDQGLFVETFLRNCKKKKNVVDQSV